ncbi:2'-5'-oligoadenylate synthase 3-like [Haliotis cracherodii]|uniref:2'-5'-oligoadenylate synthase 3-like n=1 Tax=Haliotis cracherodii TaxID=6455 RepID=UPI0039E8EA7F
MAGAGSPLVKGMNSGESLLKFIDRVVRPDAGYIAKCQEQVGKFVKFLESKNGPLNVNKIVTTGSLVSGTAERARADIDLIIYLNDYSSVRDLSRDIGNVLRHLKTYIETDVIWAKSLVFKAMTPHSAQFFLKLGDNDTEHTVDLLPAVDIAKTMSQSAIYEEMKDQTDIRRFYGVSLAPFHFRFYQKVPAKVKDLIRLVKYWRRAEDVPIGSGFIETLVIAVWREDHKPQNFDMNQYLRHVMLRLSQIKTLAVVFDDNYNHRLYRNDLKPPYLLDPCDPYKNMAPSIGDIPMVKKKADAVLESLARDGSVSTQTSR